MKKFRYLWMLLIIAVDQCTKYYIKTSFDLGQRVEVMGEFFTITYVQNTGAAFNLFDGRSKLLIIVPLVAIAVSLIYFERHRDEHWTLCLSIILIVSGGIGNLIDRICYGYVVDMICFDFFPVFNVADISICVGCGFLILYIMFFDTSNSKEVSTEVSADVEDALRAEKNMCEDTKQNTVEGN